MSQGVVTDRSTVSRITDSTSRRCRITTSGALQLGTVECPGTSVHVQGEFYRQVILFICFYFIFITPK